VVFCKVCSKPRIRGNKAPKKMSFGHGSTIKEIVTEGGKKLGGTDKKGQSKGRDKGGKHQPGGDHDGRVGERT